MTIRILIVTFLFVILLNVLGLFEPINNRIYDYYLFLNKSNIVNQDIVIIAIDEKSIKKIGYWPWPRTVYVKLLEKVIKSKPAVIGIHLS
ncbi:MAG: CHASE2 domain-containing protein, partial [Cyanobacteriota bacterium]